MPPGTMTLTLEIINPESLTPGTSARMVFRGRGGTIGRLAGSDWCLPHESVSGRHAVIVLKDGEFSIQDNSRNGIFINSRQERLARGETYPLTSGDLIIIEPYEIGVEVSTSDAPAAFREPLLASDVKIEDLFRDGGRSSSGAKPPRAQSSAPITDGLMELPQVAAPRSDGGVHIPEDWLSEHTPPPTPDQFSRKSDQTPAPAPGPAQPARSEGLLSLSEVLRAAGLNAAVAAPDLAEDFGRILKIVVGGLMEMLQARQRLKSEFRVEGTTYKPRDNNPLKFSVDVEDALYNLLVKRHPGYLGPVPAFKDAFDDVKDHELAMLEGMRVAFEAMLKRFDPAPMQEEFDRTLKKGALVAVPGKLRYWELYGERFRDMVRDPEASFRDLFGDDFANAYEEQLKRLKARRRDASS
jgi:type VI secretion system protein ImpI